MKDIQNIDVIVPEVISFLWNIRFSDALLNDVTLHEKCTFKNNHQKIKSILCYMVYCSENKKPKNFFDITEAISPVIEKYFKIIYKDQTLNISFENNSLHRLYEEYTNLHEENIDKINVSYILLSLARGSEGSSDGPVLKKCKIVD